MCKLQLLILFTATFFSIASCQDKSVAVAGNHIEQVVNTYKPSPPDSLQLEMFFTKYHDAAEFKDEMKELYKKRDYNYIWFDDKGLTEFADAVYNQVNQISEEGLTNVPPYKQQLDIIFFGEGRTNIEPDADFLISAAYFFYTNCVYSGLDVNKSMETGWFMPREKTSYVAYLDTLIKSPGLITDKNNSRFFSQYNYLRKALRKYRDIEKKGGWPAIILEPGVKSLKPGDSLPAIRQIRTRLFLEGYLATDTGNTIYDEQLSAGIIAYKKRNNREADATITPALIDELNITVAQRIKTISVNMERCRWLSPALNDAKEFVAVNIPSYRLHYFRDGKPYLISKVVVGKEVTKTVVFSGEISYIAFSPYWNVPQSILKNEILPAIAKNPNYLAEHNMEWNGDKVRQKPGGNNALGLVKFMFPNSNNIYLHDTPAKSLFNREGRAFSHGCIRVEKARELAIAITGKDGNWTPEQVDGAMNAGKENIYRLKKKIPVYIGYFTAWADENGNTAFFEDVYNRDNKLADLLYKTAL